MLVLMKPDATVSQISGVVREIEHLGLKPHPTRGADRTVIGVVEARGGTDLSFLKKSEGVEQVIPISKAYKMVSREFKPDNTVVSVAVGGDNFVVFAGPCAVEAPDQVVATARAVRSSGASILRGGAFKPRTSPYSFQGLGKEGLKILRTAKAETGLPIVTEVVSPDLVELVSEYTDVLQIGARNMQNYALLEAAGAARKPVLLKRGMMSTWRR
jgi:3-deoxy-7-phosphoheptulonate synthase